MLPPLSESSLAAFRDPLLLFARWYADARRADAEERPSRQPEAMVLATADAAGAPSARVVLYKGHDARGFRVFTHLGSRKGTELRANPRASLVFFWSALERQIRVEGAVEILPAEESDAYFATRPRSSRVGAHASEQSRELPDRAALERRVADVEAEFAGRDVPRPADWGGLLIVPRAIEFWQAGESRLHDRFRFERGADDAPWRRARLAP